MENVLALVPNMTVEEKETSIKLEKVLENAFVVSNIIELTTDVISNLSVKDVSDTIGKETLGRAILSNLVAKRLLDKTTTQE